MGRLIVSRHHDRLLRETKFMDATIRTVVSKDEMNKFRIGPKFALRFFESSPETVISFLDLNMYQMAVLLKD